MTARASSTLSRHTFLADRFLHSDSSRGNVFDASATSHRPHAARRQVPPRSTLQKLSRTRKPKHFPLSHNSSQSFDEYQTECFLFIPTFVDKLKAHKNYATDREPRPKFRNCNCASAKVSLLDVTTKKKNVKLGKCKALWGKPRTRTSSFVAR